MKLDSSQSKILKTWELWYLYLLYTSLLKTFQEHSYSKLRSYFKEKSFLQFIDFKVIKCNTLINILLIGNGFFKFSKKHIACKWRHLKKTFMIVFVLLQLSIAFYTKTHRFKSWKVFIFICTYQHYQIYGLNARNKIKFILYFSAHLNCSVEKMVPNAALEYALSSNSAF